MGGAKQYPPSGFTFCDGYRRTAPQPILQAIEFFHSFREERGIIEKLTLTQFCRSKWKVELIASDFQDAVRMLVVRFDAGLHPENDAFVYHEFAAFADRYFEAV